MITRAHTVAFEGFEPREITVECAIMPGLPQFTIVSLPDKAVSEAKERIRAALSAMVIALPSKRITINLIPADVPKMGSHFDLAIALAMLAALEIIPAEDVAEAVSLGELSLDGRLNPVIGALPAALHAAETEKALFCPQECGPEAAWVDGTQVIAAQSLMALIQHLKGTRPIEAAHPGDVIADAGLKDMQDVKGQERAKRALEIAAAGRHHLLMVGPPGSGKSMLSARLPGLLPNMSPLEALETSIIKSLSGAINKGGIERSRPFREPHHTASMAALIGGGRHAKSGEISLAHNGVLFLDEFPEFPRFVLDALRQLIETGEVIISRANAHIKYPCKFLLLAASNPCKCGYLSDPDRACSRAPLCGQDYMGRISGPLMDRFDIRIEVPAVAFQDLDAPALGERTQNIAERVLTAREMQAKRFETYKEITTNADASGQILETCITLARPEKDFLVQVAEKFKFSARAFHRILRVSRTIADLDGSSDIERPHLAEALSFRLMTAVES